VSEIRFGPIDGDWSIFADHRHDRPNMPPPEFCPFCSHLAGPYPSEIPRSVYDVVVFDNQFPSLSAVPKSPTVTGSALYPVKPRYGAAEVIVYSARHEITLADMPLIRIRHLIEVWADRYAELGGRPDVRYVLVFENKRGATGVTIDHPHGQIYGYPEIPPRAAQELEASRAHRAASGTCLFCDIVVREHADRVRLVAENTCFLAVVPFAARWPYEVHILSRRHALSLVDLTDPERWALARLLRTTLLAYDDLFGFSLPYIMAIHQMPTDGGDWEMLSHVHVEFMPPNRTASQLKMLAGSEIGGGVFVNEMAPEAAAADLRAAPRRPHRERENRRTLLP
jgi:UDPglucose--hexose-1-phosphate uridylyltransferase